jgi:hypothetical protein
MEQETAHNEHAEVAVRGHTEACAGYLAHPFSENDEFFGQMCQVSAQLFIAIGNNHQIIAKQASGVFLLI